MKMIIDLSEEEYRTIRHIAGTQHWRNKRTAEQIIAVGAFLATGHWINEGPYAEGCPDHVYRCSECGKMYLGSGDYKSCLNCGAWMMPPESEE